MDEHLNERRRFLELYCPTGEYEEHIEEEIKAIEKKLLGTGRLAGDWFRDPADHSVIFSAISDLPIRDEDHYVVVLHSELDALKKRARDLIMDHRFSRGSGRELNQREINACCQLQSISKPNFKVEVKRRWKLRARN